METKDGQSSSRNQNTSACVTIPVRIDLLLTAIIATLIIFAVMMSIIAAKDKETRMLRYEEQLYIKSIQENWAAQEFMMRSLDRLSDELRVLRRRDAQR